MTLEGLGRGELTELVADHGLGDEHRDMLATIVNCERVSDEIKIGRASCRERVCLYV